MTTIPRRLLACIEAGGQALALFDPHERLRYANRGFTEFFGVSAQEAPSWEEMMRRCHRERRGLRIDTDDIDGWLRKVRRSFRQVPLRSFESDLVDGRWLWVTEALQDDGWLLLSAADITPLKASEACLRAAHDAAVVASLTDPLTELYNRRFILRRLEDLLASARQLRFPLCVAVIDIDHFKRINDECGHSAGDRVLQLFAAQLTGQVRPLDAIGRIGGEEFLFVMPNAPPEGARAMLTRLRKQMVDDAADRPDEPACTFSAGVASATLDDTAETLVNRADRALYIAKQRGRNRDVAMGGATESPAWLHTEP